ncbi:LUD domain-containing protein [Haloarchaeobius sp. TZWWS8]|uniref:LUD domain-containing protein n=1 Tax=Haloarchaeobius sp. TZWWS8 TaxID=3446121 RepID=UPI003EB9723F
MSPDTTVRFTAAVTESGATVDTVPAADAIDAIGAAVETPAIGVPLPFADVSLPSAVDRELTPAALAAAETGVTPARLGIAEHGSVLIRSASEGDEPVSLYPNRHVAVVAASDLVDDNRAALDWLADEFAAGRTSYVFATGPSATADMGGLVNGVHGPNEVHVVVVSDR